MAIEGAWPHDDFLWKRSDSLEITRRYRAPTARDVDMIGGCLHGVLCCPASCMHVSVSCLHIISLCLSSGKLPHLNIPQWRCQRNFVVIFEKAPNSNSTFSIHTVHLVLWTKVPILVLVYKFSKYWENSCENFVDTFIPHLSRVAPPRLLSYLPAQVTSLPITAAPQLWSLIVLPDSGQQLPQR